MDFFVRKVTSPITRPQAKHCAGGDIILLKIILGGQCPFFSIPEVPASNLGRKSANTNYSFRDSRQLNC
jgi:hypothetical protein